MSAVLAVAPTVLAGLAVWLAVGNLFTLNDRLNAIERWRAFKGTSLFWEVAAEHESVSYERHLLHRMLLLNPWKLYGPLTNSLRTTAPPRATP